MIGLDKLEAARRQLGAALALFIEDQDPVSVQVLACGAGEIVERLARKSGVEPFSTHILASNPDLDERDVREMRTRYWNAFKHATTRKGVDRADDDIFGEFDDSLNDHALFLGWFDYMRTVRKLPLEAQVFQAWYFARYPEKVCTCDNLAHSVELFGATLPYVPRVEAKRRLQIVIATFRTNSEVMDDAHTQRRPLMLRA